MKTNLIWYKTYFSTFVFLLLKDWKTFIPLVKRVLCLHTNCETTVFCSCIKNSQMFFFQKFEVVSSRLAGVTIFMGKKATGNCVEWDDKTECVVSLTRLTETAKNGMSEMTQQNVSFHSVIWLKPQKVGLSEMTKQNVSFHSLIWLKPQKMCRLTLSSDWN